MSYLRSTRTNYSWTVTRAIRLKHERTNDYKYQYACVCIIIQTQKQTTVRLSNTENTFLYSLYV